MSENNKVQNTCEEAIISHMSKWLKVTWQNTFKEATHFTNITISNVSVKQQNWYYLNLTV